jgi:hypothetical protein
LTSRALLQQIATQNASYVMVTANMVRVIPFVCVRGGYARKLVRNPQALSSSSKPREPWLACHLT